MDIFNSWLVNKYIAHRGFYNDNFPENSLPAFKNAIDNDYAIELDVHQIKDGTLVVFHDDTLDRMTGKDGYIANIEKKEDLKNYFLNNTEYTIPTLDEVLNLIDGKTPILIEIKNENNVGPLEEKLFNTLKNYKGEYAIESFNPYVLLWFKENAPEVLRGQLSCFFRKDKLSFFKKFVLKRMYLNKKTQPDFIAYKSTDLPNIFVKRYKKLPLIAWTIRNQHDYLKVAKHCDNIIFEKFQPKI